MKLYSEDNVKRAMAYSYLMGVERNPDYQPIEESILKEVEAIELPSDEELAILFHNKYEELAPRFGYKTRKDTKTFNKETDNGKLMIAACREILQILNQNK